MAPRTRRPDAAKLGHRIWDHLRDRAENMPGEFTPDARDDVTGWLWEGAVASVIREAIPGIAASDLRRAREYLSASGMVVNVGGCQRGGGQPTRGTCTPAAPGHREGAPVTHPAGIRAAVRQRPAARGQRSADHRDRAHPGRDARGRRGNRPPGQPAAGRY